MTMYNVCPKLVFIVFVIIITVIILSFYFGLLNMIAFVSQDTKKHYFCVFTHNDTLGIRWTREVEWAIRSLGQSKEDSP